jgi:hypothetical protein
MVPEDLSNRDILHIAVMEDKYDLETALKYAILV